MDTADRRIERERVLNDRRAETPPWSGLRALCNFLLKHRLDRQNQHALRSVLRSHRLQPAVTDPVIHRPPRDVEQLRRVIHEYGPHRRTKIASRVPCLIGGILIGPALLCAIPS